MSIDVVADAAAGPFAAACVVLAFAGASKIRRPFAAQPAAAALGLPASPNAVRALGVIEGGTAMAGLAIGGIGAAAVAAVYCALAFAAFRLLGRSAGTPCGCLGATDAPVTATHIVVNGAAVIASALASDAGAPLAAVGRDMWSRLAFVLLVGCGAWLVVSVLDALPSLGAAVREGGTG